MKTKKQVSKNSKSNICFLDFETTGSNPFLDFPIQIGAVLVCSDLTILKQYHSYIKPPGFASNTNVAFNIHNIEISSLQNEPNSKYVLEKFFNLFGVLSIFLSFFLCSDFIHCFHLIVFFYCVLFIMLKTEE